MNMKSSMIETLNTIVNRVNLSGCRVTAPFRVSSPMRILFDGDFSGAAYIPLFPATLHIFGIPGQIAISNIVDIDQVANDKYVIQYGSNDHISDLMVKIIE